MLDNNTNSIIQGFQFSIPSAFLSPTVYPVGVIWPYVLPWWQKVTLRDLLNRDSSQHLTVVITLTQSTEKVIAGTHIENIFAHFLC